MELVEMQEKTRQHRMEKIWDDYEKERRALPEYHAFIKALVPVRAKRDKALADLNKKK